jgi:hypothetical protein
MAASKGATATRPIELARESLAETNVRSRRVQCSAAYERIGETGKPHNGLRSCTSDGADQRVWLLLHGVQPYRPILPGPLAY